MTTTAVAAMPLLLGRKGLAGLLRMADDEIRPSNWRTLTLPPCDKFCDNEPLWYTANAVTWAVKHEILPAYGMSIPEPVEVWSQADIAEFFQIPLSTVRQRWRHRYTNAVKHKKPVPASALSKEDFCIEGVVLWLPKTVKDWGVATYKLNADYSARERRGNHWTAPPPPPSPVYIDPKQPLIDSGTLMGYAEIAAFCGVKPKTVKAWHNSDKWDGEFQVGKDFPEPDGGVMDDLSPLWKRTTIEEWAGESFRAGKGRRKNPHGSGQRPRRTPKWLPATVIGWACGIGKLSAGTRVPKAAAEDGMWTRDDIAAYFGMSTETVRQWTFQTQWGFPDPDGGDPIRRKQKAA